MNHKQNTTYKKIQYCFRNSLPPVSAVKGIESVPFVCVCACQLVSTLTAKWIDLRTWKASFSINCILSLIWVTWQNCTIAHISPPNPNPGSPVRHLPHWMPRSYDRGTPVLYGHLEYQCFIDTWTYSSSMWLDWAYFALHLRTPAGRVDVCAPTIRVGWASAPRAEPCAPLLTFFYVNDGF